jgi:DNA-binding response OmpR family regulator
VCNRLVYKRGCHAGKAAHIMILTPRRQTTDKVAAFKRGVDDYLTKLFMMAELLVRVEADLPPGFVHVRIRQTFSDPSPV